MPREAEPSLSRQWVNRGHDRRAANSTESPARATHSLGPNDAGFWDANDVANFLKASRSWVYQQAEAGKLPCVRFVGLLRFDPQQIRAPARGELPAGKRVVAIAVGPRR